MTFRLASTLGRSFVAACVAGLAMTAAMAPSWAQTPQPAPSPSPITDAMRQKMAAIPSHPERPVIVELFSSQGCGNCPDANRVLWQLAMRTDVIALTYPVGIWDYLGWDDTFAKTEFFNRQKDYNKTLGHRGPYTPQMVFSGRYHSSGVNLDNIAEGFSKRSLTPYAATIAFGANGEIQVSGDPGEPANVVLIKFKPGFIRMTPGGGANQGKPMAYYNLVTGVTQLGKWSGGTVKFKAPDCDSAGAGCTVLVQQKGSTGLVIGAAQKKVVAAVAPR